MRLGRPCFINKSTTARTAAIRTSYTSMHAQPGATWTWDSSRPGLWLPLFCRQEVWTAWRPLWPTPARWWEWHSTGWCCGPAWWPPTTSDTWVRDPAVQLLQLSCGGGGRGRCSLSIRQLFFQHGLILPQLVQLKKFWIFTAFLHQHLLVNFRSRIVETLGFPTSQSSISTYIATRCSCFKASFSAKLFLLSSGETFIF